MNATFRIFRSAIVALVACLIASICFCGNAPAHAAELKNATALADPSTAQEYSSILGDKSSGTIYSGRVWADKSVFTADTTLDGVTLACDEDFLVAFSALGSSMAKSGPGFTGVPSSPIGGTDRALTFTDPLGQYLEPGDEVAVILFGVRYDFTATSTSDDAIVYSPVLDQAIVNQSYGSSAFRTFRLSDLSISATRNAEDDRWVMTIRIPDTAMPLNVGTVSFAAPDAAGHQRPVSFTTNANTPLALPLRIVYSVGVQANMKTPAGALDLSKLSVAYQEKHLVSSDTGTSVALYANYFDDPSTLIDPSSTRGNAKVAFDPAPENGFYYFQEHCTVYRSGTPGTYIGDPVNLNKVSGAVSDLYELQSAPKESFYVVKEYYRQTGTGGAQVAYEVIEYTGDELARSVGYYDPQTGSDAAGPGKDIVVATKIGGACLGNLQEFRTPKASNPTDTASLAYVGSYVNDAASFGGYTLEASYGNNGRLLVPYGSSDDLVISGQKRFDIDGTVWSPDIADFQSFRFQVLPAAGNPAQDPLAADGAIVSSDGSGAFSLDLGSYERPGTYSYVVRECMPTTPIQGVSYDPSLYTITVKATPNASGKLETTTTLHKHGTDLGPTGKIEFVNAYDTHGINMPIQGTKHLTGAALEGGMCSFTIEQVRATGVMPDGSVGPIDAPLPAHTTVACDGAGIFTFGPLSFDQAGEFVYRVSEVTDDPTSYAYDDSSYLVTITVEHTGTGPLRAEMKIEKEAADGSSAAASAIVFENRIIPPALKVSVSQKANSTADGFDTSALEVKSGTTITYHIDVKNPSALSAKNVLLYDEIPPGLQLASDVGADMGTSAPGPYLHEGRLYWVIPELAGGETFSAEFSLSVPDASAGAEWTNDAATAYTSPLDRDQVVQAASNEVLARFIASPNPPGPDDPKDDGETGGNEADGKDKDDSSGPSEDDDDAAREDGERSSLPSLGESVAVLIAGLGIVAVSIIALRIVRTRRF